jgi:hypothetical protein
MRGSGGTPSMGVCPTARRSRPSKTPGVPPDRGLVQRILIVTPANLMFQWQREMKHKFRENFEIADRRDFQERPLSFAIRPHLMAGKSSESTTP